MISTYFNVPMLILLNICKIENLGVNGLMKHRLCCIQHCIHTINHTINT